MDIEEYFKQKYNLSDSEFRKILKVDQLVKQRFQLKFEIGARTWEIKQLLKQKSSEIPAKSQQLKQLLKQKYQLEGELNSELKYVSREIMDEFAGFSGKMYCAVKFDVE